MRTRWLAILMLLLARGASLGAQMSESLRDAISRFESAWYGGKLGEARTQLGRIYSLDSDEVYRYAEEAEQLFLHGDAPLTDEAVDTLAGIYSSAILHDTLRRTQWLVSRALLLQSHLPVQDQGRRMALHDAVHKASFDCPLNVMEAFLQDRFDLCKRGRITAPMLLRDWVACDHALTCRQVLRPSEDNDAAQLQIWSTNQLRETVPDCNSLQKTARQHFGKGITSEQVQAWYYLLHLRNCGASSLMDSLETRLLEQETTPYWFRIAAQLSLNQEKYDDAHVHAHKALELETNAQLRAGDMLLLAQLEALRSKHAEAKRWLQEASRLHPTWGEPYLRLAELYVSGGGDCRLSKFDQRAVYWAGIELCTLAKNVDPSVEKDANRRIVEYRDHMPTAEECSFRGLRPGDTYPILCWMDITTTVKVK